MSQNIWIKRENEYYGILDEKNLSDFSSRFQCSEVIIKILLNRGYKTEEEIYSYLTPRLFELHDPEIIELMPNINAAVNRLKKAYYEKEKIIIYGDYDTDGIISTAILYNFLKDAGFYVTYNMPDRFKDGYDINLEFIKKNSSILKKGLLICVDCGTNAEPVKQFVESKKNFDVIVCDHHEPIIEMPVGKTLNAKDQENNDSGSGIYIIVNPKLQGSLYPYKSLSGAGVTFKFIIAALRSFDNAIKNNFSPTYLKDILDLIAVSTVADVMPLTGENRIIVSAGLKMLKDTKNYGLKKILSSAFGKGQYEKKEKFSARDIGFIVAPRINAAGRIKSAESSLSILINKDIENIKENEIEKLVSELETSNIERRNRQQNIFNEICHNFDFQSIVKNEKIFIGYSDKWDEGVIGIVASLIAKKYNIPAILFHEQNGKLKGSGRSVSDFDLYKNLSSYSKHFIKFGGHKKACGITMKKENFDAFKKSICSLDNKELKGLITAKKFLYDVEIKFQEIDMKLLKDIEKMEPFGEGNKKPLFLTSSCKILSSTLSSKNGRHLFLKIENSGRILDCVFFDYATEMQDLVLIKDKNKKIDILFNINNNSSNNLQLSIKDIRSSG
ncbi:MAG: single-stranded-DNA-specific exonuclease RecJ [Actinobacteria bacterium]|nr:single-stranded-DNA-specific exonuclease RecJ [Actinomycetota bacterium]